MLVTQLGRRVPVGGDTICVIVQKNKNKNPELVLTRVLIR